MNELMTSKRFELEITWDYDPGRPCPPCSNPDSPAYSDPGDPEYLDMLKVNLLELDGGGAIESEKDIKPQDLIALLGDRIVASMEADAKSEAEYQAAELADRYEEEKDADDDRRYRKFAGK